MNGIYFMYYCISSDSKSTSAIGLATSLSMEDGSWYDHGSIGIGTNSLSGYNAIDPNWIIINDRPYLNFGSSFNGLQQVPMGSPFGKAAQHNPYQISYNSSGWHMQEGSFMFQHGDYYYLLFSAGFNDYPTNSMIPSGDEYRIVMCRSTTGTNNFLIIFTPKKKKKKKKSLLT